MQLSDIVPDFTLKDQNNEDFNLYDIKDKLVLLSFHPLAWTGVCAKQMQSLESSKSEFDDLDVIAVGVSVDSIPSKKAWAENLGIKETKLLADFWSHGALAESLGLFNEDKGISNRANILVGKNKEIVFMKIYEMSTVPDFDEITSFIKKERKKGRKL
ncbi:MAG: redoxin domain-containing protein [Candidatus Heimdallarchaeota archaeon]|nr:redoxin domain-containing protein [Candidatus Heimdallarchaeota archaeon]